MAAAVTLILTLITFRLVAGLSGDGWMQSMANFSPMAAIVLCGAAFFPRKWALAIPLAAILITDAVLNLHYGLGPFTGNTVAILLAFALVFWIGRLLKRRELGRSLPCLMGGSLAGSLIFYIITNSSVWLLSSSSVYPRTVEGWIQCMTVGTPGFPPTYVFLRNSLGGDLFFTAVFWAVLVLSAKKQHEAKAFHPRSEATGSDAVRPL